MDVDEHAFPRDWRDRHGDHETVEEQAARLRAYEQMAEQEREVERVTANARAKAAAATRAAAELVDAVAELEQHEGALGATWRQWVAWQCGLTSSEASRVCNLAKRLPGLPLIDADFRAGRLSEGVTELLTRVATPDNERMVLETTHCATGQQLQVLVADFRRMLRGASDAADDGTDDDDRQLAASDASWGWDEHGRFTGRWDLRPDDGATVQAALEGALAELRPSEEDIDANPVTEGTPTPEEKHTARWVDALLALAEGHLASTADDGVLPESHQIILRRDLRPDDILPDGTILGPVGSVCPTLLDGAGAIVRRLAEAMSCDALVITQDMINGFPVSAPTTSRTFSRSQRRALRARDRTCRFPGCGRTKHLHAHHTRHWEHTHQTSVAQGVLLCRKHHTHVHVRGYTVELGTDGSIAVRRPDGTTLRGGIPPAPPPTATGCRNRPPDPDPTLRLTGTGERLTRYARDVICETWARGHPRPPDPVTATPAGR
jgi:hypothetical protein